MLPSAPQAASPGHSGSAGQGGCRFGGLHPRHLQHSSVNLEPALWGLFHDHGGFLGGRGRNELWGRFVSRAQPEVGLKAQHRVGADPRGCVACGLHRYAVFWGRGEGAGVGGCHFLSPHADVPAEADSAGF